MMKLLPAALLALACALASPVLADVPVSYTTSVNNKQTTVQVTPATPLPDVSLMPGTPLTASSGNVANASAVATLGAVSGKTTYLIGFRCQAAGSTAALVVNLTVVGLISGTETYTFVFPTGATAAAISVGRDYSHAIPASAANTAIVVTLPAGGAGNTNASCVAEGFQF